MVFGIGAFWENRDDMVPEFLRQHCACIGWSREDAPTLYDILEQVRIGSIVYLKSYNPQSGLRIKAVGIVTGTHMTTSLSNESLAVSWLWTGEDLVGMVDDKYPVRTCTIYEEPSREIQERVVSLLLSAAGRQGCGIPRTHRGGPGKRMHVPLAG